MNPQPSTSAGSPQAPDFRHVRKYLRSIAQREVLGRFIKAQWTSAELAEYARSMCLVPGQSKPTAVSYQFVIEQGPDHQWAQEALTTMRAPGYIMPPFDRPEPKRYAWNDPDNPEHTQELKAEVDEVARQLRNRFAHQHSLSRPEHDEPVGRALWKRAYRLRNRYHSLEDTLFLEGLSGYQMLLVATEAEELELGLISACPPTPDFARRD